MHTTWWLWTYPYIHGMITISKVLNISIIFQNFLVFLCACVLSGRSPNMRSMLSTCYFWCMKRRPYFQRSRPLHHIPTWSRTTCSKTIFALVDFDVLSFFLSQESQGEKNFFKLIPTSTHTKTETKMQKTRSMKLWPQYHMKKSRRLLPKPLPDSDEVGSRWSWQGSKSSLSQEEDDGWEVPGASEWRREEELPSERAWRGRGRGRDWGDSANRRKTKLTLLPAL
jgi:hypothetical protein